MRTRGSESERLTALLAACHDDPDLFNSAILGRPDYWWRQREFAQSLVDYRITVAYTGNSLGKDYFFAGAVPWWLYTRHNSLAILLGPTQQSLGSVTWKELRLAVENSLIPLGAKISKGVKCSPQTLTVGSGWQALGYSTTTCERASGQHNRKILVGITEASAVEDEIWDAADSFKYTKLFAYCNPLRPDGRVVKLIHQAEKDRRDGVPKHLAVNAIRVPSTDSPDADLDESPRGLADKTWLADCARRYGVTSLWYRSHVLAEIPTVSAESLLPDAWLDWAAAQTRPAVPVNHPIHQTRRLACDLSEGVGRDSTCVLVRDDWGILEVIVSNTIGLPEAAQLMRTLGQKWGIPPGRMSYDVLGVGRSMKNHLSRHGLEAAVPYAGEAGSLDPSFTNLRTEAAWKLRNRLDPQFIADSRNPHAGRQPFSIPTHPWYSRLREELKPLTYELHGRQTKLLSKKDWVEKLGFSPDIADSLIQSFSM